MIRIRRARDTDTPVLAGLLSELGYPAAPDALPHRLELLAQHGSAVLVAVREHDVPLGLACVATLATIHADAPVGYITALVTAQTARGTGVGRALVLAAEEWARAQGCIRLSVTSAEHRADAHAFYPACGMPYTGRRFTKSLTA
jgi:GNAT superfamily N-acetyltransferase